MASFRVSDRVLAMADQDGCAPTSATDCRRRCHLPNPGRLSLVYDTAWFALRERARVEPGEAVLVLGASGGVGQAACSSPAPWVRGYLPGLERAASARAAGADAVIDLSAADLRETWRAQVYAVTEGRGVDVILDPLGGTISEAAVPAHDRRYDKPQGQLSAVRLATVPYHNTALRESGHVFWLCAQFGTERKQ